MSDGDLATPFRERASRALGDTFLQEALTIATTKFITLRQEAFGDYPEGEALRDRARAIKEATLQQRDVHLEVRRQLKQQRPQTLLQRSSDFEQIRH